MFVDSEQSPIPPFKHVMVFIDGGYLREGLEKITKEYEINFNTLVDVLEYEFGLSESNSQRTRVYYYDAIVEASDDIEKHKKQKEYFHNLAIDNCFEVKLGRQVKSGKGGHRQKGVDILICIDMLTKAFQNFYDIAIFIGGDDDFVDLIKIVKNFTNKQVYGVAFQHNVSPRLLENFDVSHLITKEDCHRAKKKRAKL